MTQPTSIKDVSLNWSLACISSWKCRQFKLWFSGNTLSMYPPVWSLAHGLRWARMPVQAYLKAKLCSDIHAIINNDWLLYDYGLVGGLFHTPCPRGVISRPQQHPNVTYNAHGVPREQHEGITTSTNYCQSGKQIVDGSGRAIVHTFWGFVFGFCPPAFSLTHTYHQLNSNTEAPGQREAKKEPLGKRDIC